MIIGVLKDILNENRVCLTPSNVASLLKLSGLSIFVENGAGESSYIANGLYEESGAKLCSRDEVISSSDIILQVNAPDEKTLSLIKDDTIIVGALNPLHNLELVKALTKRAMNAFSLDLIPRTSSRGQSMDILSSMASIAGYKSVLWAANHSAKFLPMFMTAAGTIRPAKVLILGAGVAGLQAIATAKRLGAVVSAFDVRSAVKEQVNSLGAKFIEVEGATEDQSAGGYAVEQSEEYKKKQAELIQEQALASDIIITTAQIPGKKAPLLITESTINNMMAGSIIVDLAASTGGNTELTKNNEIISINDVTINGNSYFPSQLSMSASKMFGNNMHNFIKLMIDEEGNLKLDFNDELIAGTCLTYKGEVKNERVQSMLN